MKKLMITVGAVAIAAGAFATAPTVYDYKASVKHMYLKVVTVRDTSILGNPTVHVYQKIQQTSSLKGYLIQDTQACLGGVSSGNAASLGLPRAWDHRRNRAFLVVINSSATPARIRQPKILPAVLEAKFMDKALTSRNYLTEGMLFVGGELVTPANNTAIASFAGWRPYLMPGTVAGVAQPAENPDVPGPRLRQTGKAFYGDYFWTSVYLFGQYNGPQWSTVNWSQAEKRVIAAMPQWMKPRNTGKRVAEGIVDPKLGANGYFHDTWMNHAGFGTGNAGTSDIDVCCGLPLTEATPVTLESLSGNMKGGCFLCSENGFYTGQDAVAPYGVYRAGALWEDQFWSPSINTAAGHSIPAAYYGGVAVADRFQMDVWTDGDIESFTTDVMSGTWSIKRNRRLTGVALTNTEVDDTFLFGACAGTAPAISVTALIAPYNVAGTTYRRDVWDFNEMLKGAAQDLNRGTGNALNFADGSEISSREAANRFDGLPMITPKFAAAYGLDGQHLFIAAPVTFKVAADANSVYR